jgi:poly(A) polymerase
MRTMPIDLSTLATLPFRSYLASYSALDHYFRITRSAPIHLLVENDLAGLARHFDHISFPGEAFCDASTRVDGVTLLFTCAEDRLPRGQEPFPVADFLFDIEGERFLDIGESYRQLRNRETEARVPMGDPVTAAMQGAILESRYEMTTGVTKALQGAEPAAGAAVGPGAESGSRISEAEQALLLTEILTGVAPARGLRILSDLGLLEAWFPELAAMSETDHSKEYHPEGNVWEHTLHTFEYQKNRDLVLGLALLLHDAGKPLSEGTREKPFLEHSHHGATVARRFLRRLGFPEDTIENVAWLIRYHMIPGALHRLPTRRTASLMRSPLFPALLELYRCDLSSTFRGPEGYYRACRVYKDFLKNERNPYRREDGKKELRSQAGYA